MTPVHKQRVIDLSLFLRGLLQISGPHASILIDGEPISHERIQSYLDTVRKLYDGIYVQTPKKENHDSQPVPTIPIQPGAPGTPRADGAGAQGTASDGARSHCRICGFAVDTSIPPIKPEVPWGGRNLKRDPDA